MKKCSHCESRRYVKNGSHKGIQRYICLDCNRRFSDIPPKFSYSTKLKAVKMYLRNGGMRAVADSFGVNASTILRWVRAFHKSFSKTIQKTKEQLSLENEPDIIELDEIYSYCQKNKIECSHGLLILGEKVVLLSL
ncbi:MAG: helix-turn-helix domain-containing protein [Candidatus Caenarcaniphilales bacterium]|nr:helix-turn-helix domain-containing protein [Candidatus Caenarcaniphilales bacterium]